MLVDSFTIWYEMIQAMRVPVPVPAPLRVYWRARTFSMHVWLASDAEVKLKRLQFDVLVKTFCDWVNALLVKKKETELAVMGGQP